ncbi:MAG: efflux RND transporter permease subunit [Cytophagales bacterium]
MSLSTISINRPVLAIVMNLIILIFGYLGFQKLGVREFPAIDPPIVTVRTSYTGASAEVIESQITEPIERVLSGIENIKSISSASNQGNSTITIEFELGADMETATNDVRDKVGEASRRLPVDIDAPPVVVKADANSDAILSMTISSEKRNALELSDFAENVVAQRFLTIPGVSNIQIWGQKKFSMRIWMSPQKMAALGVTALDIKRALERENVELPSGKIYGNRTELTVKTNARLQTEEEFNNLIISSKSSGQVLLKDVAKAELGPENLETVLRESGKPMVATALIPMPGSNHLDIAKEFYHRKEQLLKEIPKDYVLDVALDNTRFVEKSIEEVVETLAIAIVLVVLIIYLFFRDWSISLRPLIDIPVSLIGTFFVMYLLGFSINVLTLLAIVLATGLVVDDGIVVTENIFKKLEQGLKPKQAAILGSNEIVFAVISTSITLAAVFLPIIFMEGFVGRLFREFGIVVSAAVLISSFVSLTLTPMLNARFLKSNQKQNKFYQATEPYFLKLNQAYETSLENFLKKKWLAFVFLGVSLLATVYLWNALPKELAPLEDRSMVRMSITAPEGASYEYTDQFMYKISDFVRDSIPEAKLALTVTSPAFAGSGAVNTGFSRIPLVEPQNRKRSQQEIADYLTAKTRTFPEAKTFVVQDQTISTGGGPRVGLPVQFVIQAPNFDSLRSKLPIFMELAQKDARFSIVDVNLKFNRPELEVEIDRAKCQKMGLSAFDVGQTLQLALSGQRYGYFLMNGKQYQVIGQFNMEDSNEPMDLKNIQLRTPNNQLIPLHNLVSTKEVSNPPQLYRYNRYVSATVSAGLAPGVTLGQGIDAMNEIADSCLNESFSKALSGPSRDFAESSSNTFFVFILALLLVYLILAAQFESFRDPLIIMLTVPLALGGAVFSLWLFNQTMNIFSQIGLIMLIGLVTKNGILIVEFANQLKEKGLKKSDAVLNASVNRLRPVLMTSMATILGALPIALALGSGAVSRIGMGVVIVGGLSFSLVFTLYVIPSMYLYFSKNTANSESETKLVPNN